jgi:hypothetical protein
MEKVQNRLLSWNVISALGLVLYAMISVSGQAVAAENGRMQKRWLFEWRDLSNPKEVDGMIARFPAAKASGYNGVVFSWNVAREKASELKQAAKANGLELVAIVMGGSRDRNYMEGVPVKDAVYVVHDYHATLEPDTAARLLDGDFEDVNGNKFRGWTMQDDEGVVTFADHEVVHGGKASLRMENVAKNPYQHSRLAQLIRLKPFRQYRISFWLKTEELSPADGEVKVLSADGGGAISFQTFHVERTQEWKLYDVVFNSLGHTNGRVYLGTWNGKKGKMWWDDMRIEEIGLVNVLRRPGCPVVVKGEDMTVYEEGRDYQRIVDPQLHPWVPYHEQPPIKLAPGSRIKEGARLRVSYYHPLIVYEDRLTSCLSEPKIFADWEAEVRQANDLLYPAGYLMGHDELRVMNWCAACQERHMTPGALLAWNVKQSAAIIRKVRPDAEIWVWSDMFDPMHNAVEHYYAVNGSLTGSWKGLDKDVGIVNWQGGLKGKNCKFFADLGLRQILSGYYDSDEDGSGIAEWLANTKEVPGIVGAMYTTWEDKYVAMGTWASKAWGVGE